MNCSPFRTLKNSIRLSLALCLMGGCGETVQPGAAGSSGNAAALADEKPAAPEPPAVPEDSADPESPAAADSTAVSETPPGDDEKSPFQIPEGDTKELFAYLKTIQTSQLPDNMRSEAGAHKFLRFQVGAVMEVCDRIEAQDPDDETKVKIIQQRIGAYRALGQIDDSATTKLNKLIETFKDDERPEVRKIVSSHNLTSAAREFFKLSGEGQAALIKDLFAYMDEHGVDETSFSLATQLGEALEQTDNPTLGASIYERLAKDLKKMGEPRLQPQIAKFEGTARRMNLPGNFMELSGTTAAGEEFDWASYRGKVVLVDFWASWCGPCRAEIPNMKAQLEKYGDKGFAIVGISLDETMAQYQAVVDSEELTWVNLMSQNENERGWNSPLAVHYGVSSIPTAILVDKDGKVVSMMARGQQLNVLLDQMLGSSESQDKDETPAAE